MQQPTNFTPITAAATHATMWPKPIPAVQILYAAQQLSTEPGSPCLAQLQVLLSCKCSRMCMPCCTAANMGLLHMQATRSRCLLPLNRRSMLAARCPSSILRTARQTQQARSQAAPAVEVVDAAQQLGETQAGVGLAVGPPLQHSVQQLPARQQLCDEVHLHQEGLGLLQNMSLSWWTTLVNPEKPCMPSKPRPGIQGGQPMEDAFVEHGPA